MFLKKFIVCSDFRKWIKTNEINETKITHEETTNYIIGKVQELGEEEQDYKMWIRDSVINKLKTGEYLVKMPTELSPELVIVNYRGDYIPPIHKGVIY